MKFTLVVVLMFAFYSQVVRAQQGCDLNAIRTAMKDLPVPKEILNGLLENAKQQKSEFVQSVKGEVKNYLSKVDPTKEIEKIMIQEHTSPVNDRFKFVELGDVKKAKAD